MKLNTRRLVWLARHTVWDCISRMHWGNHNGWWRIHWKDSAYVHAEEYRAIGRGAIVKHASEDGVRAAEAQIDIENGRKGRLEEEDKACAAKIPSDVDPPILDRPWDLVLLAAVGTLDAAAGYEMLQAMRLGHMWITAAAGILFTLGFLIVAPDVIGRFARHVFSPKSSKKIIGALLFLFGLGAIAAVSATRAEYLIESADLDVGQVPTLPSLPYHVIGPSALLAGLFFVALAIGYCRRYSNPHADRHERLQRKLEKAEQRVIEAKFAREAKVNRAEHLKAAIAARRDANISKYQAFWERADARRRKREKAHLRRDRRRLRRALAQERVKKLAIDNVTSSGTAGRDRQSQVGTPWAKTSGRRPSTAGQGDRRRAAGAGTGTWSNFSTGGQS